LFRESKRCKLQEYRDTHINCLRSPRVRYEHKASFLAFTFELLPESLGA